MGILVQHIYNINFLNAQDDYFKDHISSLGFYVMKAGIIQDLLCKFLTQMVHKADKSW